MTARGPLEKEFDEKIDERLRSGDWDLKIARGVMSRRRRWRGMVYGGAGALAAACLFVAVLVYTGRPVSDPEGGRLDNFVSAQVNGTWDGVFGSGKSGQGDTIALSDLQYDASLDTMIEETLAQR